MRTFPDDLLHAIRARISGFPEGLNPTAVPFLQVVRRSQPTPFSPGVLSPSFCLIVQGSKRLHLGTRVIDYGPGEFITALIDVPAAGNVRTASPRKPYFGLRIDLTNEDIASVLTDARLSLPMTTGRPQAAFVGQASPAVLDVHLRLLQLLDQPAKAPYLSSLLKCELIYQLLTGEHGHLFLQRVLFDPKANGVGAAIAWIRSNYRRTFTMESLARAHGLSVSGLHHKFKVATNLSPLQYQKQLRLQEARKLMLGGATNAATAAQQVGYQSASQFNREYRRQFGRPPRADVEGLRRSGGARDENELRG